VKQSTFLPRLAAYCVGLPVLLVLYLFTRNILSTTVGMPLLIGAIFAAIWAQAKIRKTHPQDFKLREEWIAFGLFLVTVAAVSLFILKPL
jgi:hypothetical protein